MTGTVCRRNLVTLVQDLQARQVVGASTFPFSAPALDRISSCTICLCVAAVAVPLARQLAQARLHCCHLGAGPESSPSQKSSLLCTRPAKACMGCGWQA